MTTPSRRPVRFEERYPVEPGDIDVLGHVNNVVYLRWVQDIAGAHWRSAAPPDLQRSLVWVVLRHEIDYHRPAMPGEQVIACTWVGEATGTRFERVTEILRASDRQLLASARSIWCPIDATSGRPRRIDPSLHDHFSIAEPERGT
ncbi:MAG TPA: acyl-CoA thioesterase [Gemmatimonadales bacterium]|nr:acyl-CoA thioesterase [Gemmatimonadales bacterium]